MKALLTLLLLSPLVSLPLSAEESPALPPRLRTLQENYEAALARATLPITETYLKELDKLKAEFARSGDHASTLAAEKLAASVQRDPRGTGSGAGAGAGDDNFAGLPLSRMSIRQFKAWLRTVTITEVDSPFLNQYRWEGDKLLSRRGGGNQDREHENVIVEVGKLFVPFTSTNATLVIDESLTRAEITYSTGGRFEGRIAKR